MPPRTDDQWNNRTPRDVRRMIAPNLSDPAAVAFEQRSREQTQQQQGQASNARDRAAQNPSRMFIPGDTAQQNIPASERETRMETDRIQRQRGAVRAQTADTAQRLGMSAAMDRGIMPRAADMSPEQRGDLPSHRIDWSGFLSPSQQQALQRHTPRVSVDPVQVGTRQIAPPTPDQLEYQSARDRIFNEYMALTGDRDRALEATKNDPRFQEARHEYAMQRSERAYSTPDSGPERQPGLSDLLRGYVREHPNLTDTQAAQARRRDAQRAVRDLAPILGQMPAEGTQQPAQAAAVTGDRETAGASGGGDGGMGRGAGLMPNQELLESILSNAPQPGDLEEDETFSAREQRYWERWAPVLDQLSPQEQEDQTEAGNRVMIVDRDGQVYRIPREDLQAAIADGARVVGGQ